MSTPFSATLSALALSGLLITPAVAQEAGETAPATEEAAPAAETAEVEAPAAEETETDGAATDGTEAAETDATEPTEAEADAADEAPAEPQPGQQYLKAVHSDWAERCLKVEEGEDPCQMYQLLNDAEGNSVAEIAIVALPDAGQAVAGATIVVPLETLLTEQLSLRVDSGQVRKFPFNFCNPGGCVTRLGLTQQDVNQFRRGNQATLTMVPAAAPDQSVTVTMSLSGFTAAYDAISE
ncbi:invasion associated locus B family protein [Thalassorhabdomicrobium marinisediminis]|uniref:invasion associated locus B family protein n=1 Tax=Thalassorhabdomicrobium marinisediminis TaxID=2170577 RepID=UPI003CD0CA18